MGRRLIKMDKNVIWVGENPKDHTRNDIGGKGLNLLRLYNIAQRIGFNVPKFFIISVNAKKHFINTNKGTKVVYETEEIQNSFEKLKTPIAVRSSSPLEDGVNASFAGMFKTCLGIEDYNHMAFATNHVYESSLLEKVKRYSDRMRMGHSEAMAIIIQEQVTDFLNKGVIQLEEDKAIVETIDRDGSISSTEMEYGILDEIFPKNFIQNTNFLEWLNKRKKENSLTGWEEDYAIYCGREAKNLLGLEGVVQIEFFLSPGKPPTFVQIRQLPKVSTHAAELDMDVPEGVPYIESEICNDISGELILPTYVTVSQSGLKRILIETGQSDCLGIGSGDERMKEFVKKSKLEHNKDFQDFRNLVMIEKFEGLQFTLQEYNKSWRESNELFPEYILICDKLDETISEMVDATTNKRAIITCLEAQKTSHAMTVARDLGIMAVGMNGYIMDMNYFFNQVETGDIIHMRSNGKKAIAYIERMREKDPYKI